MGSGVRVPSPPPSESRGWLSEPLLTCPDIDTIVSRLVCINKASIVSVLFDNRIGKFPKIEIISLDALDRPKTILVFERTRRKRNDVLIEFAMSKFYGQATKGTRWMPRRVKAMKDVVSCDKLGRGANNP